MKWRGEREWRARWAAWRLSRRGFVVLRGLLSAAAVREVNRALDASWSAPDLGQLASIPPDAKTVVAEPGLRRIPGIRLLDPHWTLPAVRHALMRPRLLACLHAHFRTAPLLFQCQHFLHSPGAVWHRDNAYLAVQPNRGLLGLWMALEPVGPGQGELEFVPGSQRIPPYRFGGQRDWYTPPLDDAASHTHYVDYLTDQCRRRRLPPRRFSARPGDVLLFDGALVHGSAPAGPGSPSRRSLLAHYCASSVSPRYLLEDAGQLAPGGSERARYATGYYPTPAVGADRP